MTVRYGGYTRLQRPANRQCFCATRNWRLIRRTHNQTEPTAGNNVLSNLATHRQSAVAKVVTVVARRRCFYFSATVCRFVPAHKTASEHGLPCEWRVRPPTPTPACRPRRLIGGPSFGYPLNCSLALTPPPPRSRVDGWRS